VSSWRGGGNGCDCVAWADSGDADEVVGSVVEDGVREEREDHRGDVRRIWFGRQDAAQLLREKSAHLHLG
jgi:hypothetical protein